MTNMCHKFALEEAENWQIYCFFQFLATLTNHEPERLKMVISSLGREFSSQTLIQDGRNLPKRSTLSSPIFRRGGGGSGRTRRLEGASVASGKSFVGGP